MEKRESESERKLRGQVERLRARTAAAEARLKNVQLKASKTERARQTRQDIIIGAMLRASKRPEDIATVERLKSSLIRPQDLEAFGLAPLPKAPQAVRRDEAAPAPAEPGFDADARACQEDEARQVREAQIRAAGRLQAERRE